MSTKVIKEEIKLPALQTKEKIKEQQDTIRGSLLNLDQSIHENAVQCLMHASHEFGHGDTSLMRRLLVEVIDAKTGYRRQGLIAWMREFSPMELKGDTINLSGVDAKGHKREFRVQQAIEMPFWNLRSATEGLKYKPVFKDTALSGVNRSIKQIIDAVENTKDGKPIDPSKPFYDGIHSDKIVSFAQKVKEMADGLPADETRAVRVAQAEQQRLGEFIASNKDNVNVASPVTPEALEQRQVA